MFRCGVLLLLVSGALAQDGLPTLYEYYTSNGIRSGLNADRPYFILNGKNITILSGAMHYFRIPPQYWRDRLRKLRAAGLNTVETYVPWNLHEPENGLFDFGNGSTDFNEFLNLTRYLQMAQEEDLFAIVRPGPYICAEWEWGGFPSWLLAEDADGLEVRTSESRYMAYVHRYFDRLIPLLVDLQFTKGGPIIAMQVENEYGSAPIKDLDYIKQLYDILRENGIVELLVTSDGAGSGSSGTLPDILLQTVNFGNNPKGSFDTLKRNSPGKPIMAMEFWTGWFDHWSEYHHTVSGASFRNIYEDILSYPASVSMYMFHGGTNWGFLNGANLNEFQPTTTSYDYDAPLSEAGDYTDKYDIVKELIRQYNPIKTRTPTQPEEISKAAYRSVAIDRYLTYDDMIEKAPDVITNKTPINMESLPINKGSGQSYGYLVYRLESIDVPAGATLAIKGHIRDSVMILINGSRTSKPLTSASDLNGFGYWREVRSNATLTEIDLQGVTLDLFVENWGRGNFGNLYHELKGLTSDNTVYINDDEPDSWTMIPFEFKKEWTNGLDGWRKVNGELPTGPALYKGTLTFAQRPTEDSFIDMQDWNVGIVIVNGFVLGRYASPIGPQQSLYLPAPFLRAGDNEIIVFEHFQPGNEIKFSDKPIFRTP